MKIESTLTIVRTITTARNAPCNPRAVWDNKKIAAIGTPIVLSNNPNIFLSLYLIYL